MNNEEMNLIDIIGVIRKKKDLIISFTAATVVLTVLVCLIMPWTYRAETTLIIPQQSNKGFEGILAMSSMMSGSNMNIPGDITQSLIGRTTNFSDILKSKTITKMIIEGLDLKKYYSNNDMDQLIAKVRNKMKIKEKKGVLTINFDDRDPRIAADMANYSVIALDDFNKKGNIQFAKRLKIFIMDQLASAKVDLSDAEEKLKKFETQSQLVKLSEKELMLGRYLRDVKAKEAVYAMLLQEYEKAKIDEAKEELFFEVLDPATPPRSPYSPKPFLFSIIAAIIGAFASVFIVFLFERLESMGIEVPNIDFKKEIKWREWKRSLTTR